MKTHLFSRDVLTLVTGTTIAQIACVLASPLITRIFGPDAFGLASLFSSISGIFGIVSCLRYELAIMLPKSDEEAKNALGLCICITTILCILSIPFLMIIQQPLLLSLKAPQLSSFFFIIPLTFFLNGIYLAFNYWITRMKKFHQLSIVRMMSTCSTVGTELGVGSLGYTSGGVLIGAGILGQVISVFILCILTLNKKRGFFIENISTKGMYNILIRYSNFPKYDLWSALLNTISWQIPILIFAYFFSSTIVGYYSLGMMMVQLPMSLIGGAVAQVFLQRAVISKEEGTLNELVENILKILFTIGFFPIFVLTIIGKDLFCVLFSQIWSESGVYTQILSIWALFWFISSPLSMLYIILEKQDFGFKFNILNFLTRLGSLYIGGVLRDPVIGLLLFSGSGIIIYGYLCVKMLEFANVNRIQLLNEIINSLKIFIPAGIILIFLKYSNQSSINLSIIGISLSIIYYIYIIKTNDKLLNFLTKS